MGRKNSLRIRLIAAWGIARGKLAYPMQVMTCERCGSESIKRLKEKSNRYQSGCVWESVLKCKKCGAVCYEKQEWEWEKGRCGVMNKVDIVEVIQSAIEKKFCKNGDMMGILVVCTQMVYSAILMEMIM